jgi:peptidoglycan/xylan/chitin deacetylase (PgdA/CDA1 family)
LLIAYLAAVFAVLPSSAPKQGGIAVLCYHDLQPVAKNDMTNTPSNFEAHLKWLKGKGYKTLSVDELVAILKKKQAPPPKSIVLTFDDGYQGVYTYAYPALKKYGFKATLFLVTSVMGDESPPMPHLTWPEIEQMDREDVIRAEVHAEKLHVKLGERLKAELSNGEPSTDIEHDLQNARVEIQNHTHRPVHSIAWPFGDYTTDLIHLAAKEGYYAMLNTEYGLNYPGDSVVKIKRLRMSSKYDTLARFEQKLAHYGIR